MHEQPHGRGHKSIVCPCSSQNQCRYSSAGFYYMECRGSTHEQAVQNVWKPNACVKCRTFNHSSSQCPTHETARHASTKVSKVNPQSKGKTVETSWVIAKKKKHKLSISTSTFKEKGNPSAFFSNNTFYALEDLDDDDGIDEIFNESELLATVKGKDKPFQ